MKKTLTMLALLAMAFTGFSQGVTGFNNSGGTALTAQNQAGSTVPLADALPVTVGLYYSTDLSGAGTFSMHPTTANLGSSGVFIGGSRTFELPATPNLAPGTPVLLQVRAWNTSAGSYEAALNTAGNWAGISGNLPLELGGGPLPTPSLVINGGLTSFAVVEQVPEPSVLALGVLGIGALLFRRVRK